jgi:hypothetical protein
VVVIAACKVRRTKQRRQQGGRMRRIGVFMPGAADAAGGRPGRLRTGGRGVAAGVPAERKCEGAELVIQLSKAER